MSQQIWKFAAGIGAFDGPVTVHDQGAVAVIQKYGIQKYGIQKYGVEVGGIDGGEFEV